MVSWSLHRTRRAHSWINRLHPGVHHGQNHKRQQDMRHCNNGTQLVINHDPLTIVSYQSEPNQNVIDNTLLLKHDLQAEVRTNNEVQNSTAGSSTG